MMRIKLPLHSMMLSIDRLSLVVPDAPTPWPGDDARIVGTRLDHGVPAYEAGELTREDWPLRLIKRELNESICMMIDQSQYCRNVRNGRPFYYLNSVV